MDGKKFYVCRVRPTNGYEQDKRRAHVQCVLERAVQYIGGAAGAALVCVPTAMWACAYAAADRGYQAVGGEWPLIIFAAVTGWKLGWWLVGLLMERKRIKKG